MGNTTYLLKIFSIFWPPEYLNFTFYKNLINFSYFFLATFERKDGSKISFAQYYKERYNLEVREKAQPMLISMPKDKVILILWDLQGCQIITLFMPKNVVWVFGKTEIITILFFSRIRDVVTFKQLKSSQNWPKWLDSLINNVRTTKWWT